MKRKKKVLSLLLAMAVILAFAPMAYAAEAEETGTIVPDYSWYSESADSYTLENAEDFLGFANLVNAEDGKKATDFSGKTVTLSANIDLGGMEFKSIGGQGYKEGNKKPTGNLFKGIFDGGNKTIKNCTIKNTGGYYNIGLFGFVDRGTIKNLTIESITVTNIQTEKESSTAVAVAAVYKGNVQNVIVDSNCKVTGKNRTAGVVGSVRDESNIIECKNYAEVKGSGMYTGGVIGAAHDMDYVLVVTGKPATISKCQNYGIVNGNSEVGGIVGYSDQATISSCTNEGNISATGNYGTGGILGFDAYNPRALYKPSKGSDIKACVNKGDISGGRAAGIVGTLGVTPGRSQPTSKKVLTKISGCENQGAITGTEGKCGAIFGYQITYAKGDNADDINNLIVSIENCTLGGTVYGQAVDVPTLTPYYNK